MQALTRPTKIEFNPDAYSLDDMTNDFQVFKECLPHLDHGRSLALKKLLIGQCVLISHKIEIQSDDLGSDWSRRTHTARVCKEANIAAVNAHLQDLEHLQKVQRLRSKQPTSSYEELQLQCDTLKAKLEILQADEAHASLYKRTLCQVVLEKFGSEVSGEIRRETRQRLGVE